ncbi:sensor histidine kinase [Malikia granosa]|uniref:histidine kinase n=1 Tax=Malikia granosa TaxID=263067 RepID=A0A2S9K976_9BURK|nr:sensor histidine kinase [Malikia granosa]PRD66988.1 hypothetical protein C6P64_02335 [Malikia granosa]
MSRLMRGLLAWLIAGLLGLGAGPLRAAEVVDFGTLDSQFELSERVEWLQDQSASLDPLQAMAAPDWRAATRDDLNLGVSESAVWLRLRVENRSLHERTRWFALGSPRLEWVDFYRFAPGAPAWDETAVGGLGRALERRPMSGLVSIFPVTLAAGESATLLLRVAGRTRLLMKPELWEPMSYRSRESDLIVRQLAPISAVLGVVLYMLVHGLARRSRDMLLLAGWLCLMALYELSFDGYLYRFFFSSGGELAVRATLVLSNLCVILCAVFTLSFLRLYQQRGWRLAYLLYIAANLVNLMRTAFGDLFAANLVTVPLLLLFFLVWPISILAAWRHRVANAGLYFVATLSLWAAIILRLFEQEGWLSSDFILSDTLTLSPSLGLALVMVFGLLRRDYGEQKAYRAAQAALLKSRQDEQQRLEVLVRERTQSLQDATIAAEEAHHARGELLARVNHDLLRPVSEIVELAAPLEQAGGQPAEYGAVIHRSATHLLGLIDDLIVEASQDGSVAEIRSQPVETQSLLAGLAFEAEGLVLAGGNEFVFHPAPDLPPRIGVDSRRLRQVLINLLDNAAKFTRAGRVEFRVDADSMSSTPRLIFTVRDSGPGMSASQLAVVFEPYRRAAETAGFPGLGLGLAIARHWTERMGGEIIANSAPGQGTTMRVLLPVELPEPCQVPPSAAPQGVAVPSREDELAVPAAELLAEASALLRLGAVSDLEDWAADLLTRQPQHAAFARRVAELAGHADLRALARLLQRPAP